ncbi:luciferin sulfotransferase-like [Onthophagus taurus]|uniref:luciferin sulfotransferase-like n=1 Tax=Onthophagus taurus TaxID=166361 RepID=UPI0039BE2A70
MGEVMKDLKDFDGCILPNEFFLTKEKIEHFEVKDDDVWVTSYPKAGTTWTQEMVWLIGNDLDYEGAKVSVDQRFPFIEVNSLTKAMMKFGKKRNPEKFSKEFVVTDNIKKLNETEGKRFIKSHLPWYLLPRQITDGLKKPKIIHVMRDPKQVSVSYYHHNNLVIPLFDENLSNFIDIYVQGKVLYGDYFNVVKSYLKQSHLPNLLIITYEDMIRDIKSVIKKVSEFLNKNFTDEDIDKLAEHLSFNQMKNNQAVNREYISGNDDEKFMRKGTVDSYKEELSDEDIDKLNKWFAENIKGSGLPYETN